MMERRRALDGSLPKRVVRRQRDLPMPDAQGVRRPPRPAPASAQVSTTMAFAGLLRDLLRDKGIGPAGRADHPRRGPHLRHGLPLPRGRHLRRPRPALRAGRRPPAPVLQGVEGRPDPGGGHHRGRLDGQLHRRRHRLRHPRHADGARSSSSIRCSGSSGWATSSGPSATPGAGASCAAPPPAAPPSTARASSTPTATAWCWRSTVPNLAAYDPAFAYELGVIVEDGIRRMYGARAGGRLLLPHPLQRELRHAADARRAPRTGIRRGLYRFARRPRGPRPPGDGDLQRHRPGRGPGGPGDAGRRPRRGRRAVERHVVQGPAGGRPVRRAVEPAPPHRHAPHALRHRGAHRRRGAGGGRHRLHEGGARPGGPVGPGPVRPPRHRRLRAVGHVGQPPPPLRDRRRPRGGGRPRLPGPGRRGQARGGGRRHRPLRPRRRDPRPPRRADADARHPALRLRRRQRPVGHHARPDPPRLPPRARHPRRELLRAVAGRAPHRVGRGPVPRRRHHPSPVPRVGPRAGRGGRRAGPVGGGHLRRRGPGRVPLLRRRPGQAPLRGQDPGLRVLPPPAGGPVPGGPVRPGDRATAGTWRCRCGTIDRHHTPSARQLAQLWRRAVAAGRTFGAAHPDRYAEVRYEDLVDDAEAELRRLCPFLALDFDPAMLDHRASADRLLQVVRRGPTSTPACGWSRPVACGTGRWRWTPADVAAFEEEAGATLRACGYPTAPVPAAAAGGGPVAGSVRARRPRRPRPASGSDRGGDGRLPG